MCKAILSAVASLTLIFASHAYAEAFKPIRILIVSGGGWHDYAAQRDILETGLKARLNAEISHVYYDMTPEDAKGAPKLPIFGKPNYAEGYDVVIHNECAADVTDPEIIADVLAPHIKGVPGVNLHCAMHSYRFGDWRQPVADGALNARWFEYVGLQSSGHGAQYPITLTVKDPQHPVAKGLDMWVTPDEELYNNLKTYAISPIISGQQLGNPDPKAQAEVFTVAWTHFYGPARTRVFSTTLAHNEVSMRDPLYLDLVARGVLWAVDGLKPDGTPAEGYGASLTPPHAPAPGTSPR